MPYIPTNKRGTASKKKRIPLSGTYAEKPAYQKVDVQNANTLKRLAQEGQLPGFEQYQERKSLGDRAKEFGSGVLDVLQRGEYATAGAYEEAKTGGNPLARAGRELFSGIGGIQGEKKTFGEVRRELEPEYAQFSQEHPIASTATDLAMSIGLDPTSWIPAKAIAKVGGAAFGAATTGVAAVAKRTEIGKSVLDGLGSAFVPGHAFKKIGQGRIWDTIQEEKDFRNALERHYGEQLKPTLDAIPNMKPETVKNLIRAGYGDGLPDAIKNMPPGIERHAAKVEFYRRTLGDEVADALAPLGDTMREVGRRESRYALVGKKGDERKKIFSWLRDDYMPNNVKAISDFMENAGEYVQGGIGKAGALNLWKQLHQRGKRLTTGDDFLNWAKTVGIKDEDLGAALAQNFYARIGGDVNQIRNIRLHNRLTKEMPDVFRKIPAGTRHIAQLGKDGTPIVKPGETLFMPAGNLRFFPTTAWDSLSKDTQAVLQNGGELTKQIVDELTSKKLLSATSRVQTYAVPVDVVKGLQSYTQSLGKSHAIIGWYDRALSYFKNTAIFSTFFHARNAMSNAFQLHIADMDPARYGESLTFWRKNVSGDKTGTILGKPFSYWEYQGKKHNILGGSFVGQQVGQVGLPGVRQAFEFNRKIGQNIENVGRMALFMDRIQKGLSPAEAARDVKKFLFDYDELTDFERQFMRRIAPFYTWARKNVPLQLEMIMKAPKKYQHVAKLKDALSGGETNQNNPDWWRNQDVWEIKGGKFAVQVGLPYADLNLFGGAGPAGQLGILGSAINYANNYDPFYGEPIREYAGQATPLLAERMLYVDPKIKYALNAALPVVKRYAQDLPNELINVASGNDPDKVNKYKAIAHILGVRVIPQVKTQQEKARVYRLQEQLRNYDRYMEQQLQRQQ